MKIAYLIDRDVIGGGMEYVHRKLRAHGESGRVFYADRGECTSAKVNAWGADAIVVNHLRALLQLFRNPFVRPRGRVTFVVHGIHWRKYDWKLSECSHPHGFYALSLRVRRDLRQLLESRLYHRCDEIVALTESDKADVLRLYGRNLRVVVEPNTLDGWEPKFADGLPPGAMGEFQYVCIGRFSYQKGQDRWIRAMRNSVGRTLFIGDGETMASCKALARKLDVADRCIFAGAIPEADRYLKCAPVVVSPSRWEGMPYLMMKARALGCQILATDCPGNRDVLAGYDKWEKLAF